LWWIRGEPCYKYLQRAVFILACTTGIQVDFANATELNINGYSIEKSANGVNFNSIAVLSPKTNNGAFNAYSFIDITPFAGNNYYRIKATERSGNIIYSTIVKLSSVKSGAGISIYPNPVKGKIISLQLENLDKDNYTISLYNHIGQIVFSKQIAHEGGSATEVIELPSTIPGGVYDIQAGNNTTRYSKSIIIE
jgi:hypothetical protein